MSRLALIAVLLTQAVACGTDSTTTDPPVFPPDYAATYQQVRNCRFSLEHDLLHIRVLASSDALAAYTGRTTPFPTGAIVLKEQYGENDTACTGPIVNFTVMQKVDVGSAPATLDWTWQKVDSNHHTLAAEDIKRCVTCHKDCRPPDGYDATCTVP